MKNIFQSRNICSESLLQEPDLHHKSIFGRIFGYFRKEERREEERGKEERRRGGEEERRRGGEEERRVDIDDHTCIEFLKIRIGDGGLQKDMVI